MKTQGSQEQLLGQLETGAMRTGGMEETGSSAQGDKGAAQKQRREPRGLEEGLKGMGSRVGSRQNWQRSGWELEWHQQCFCYLQGTSKWRRRPRMWQRDSTQGTRGEKQGPSNHRSSQRRKWGRCLQSFHHQGLFLVSQQFTSGIQSIGASASVLPMSIQG